MPDLRPKIAPRWGAVKKREVDLTEYRKQVETLTAEVNELKQEQVRIQNLNDENQRNKDRKTKLAHDRELAVLKKDSLARETESSIVSLETAIGNENTNLERLIKSTESEVITLNKVLIEKSDALGKAEQRLDEAKKITVRDPAAELEQALESVTNMKEQIGNYHDVRTERETAIRQNEQMKKQKEADEVEIKRLDTELRDKARETAELETCAKVLKNEFPVYVISKIVKDLETSMNDFLRKTYGGRYTVKLEDRKNALRMVYGPKGMDAGLASGYEKSIFSLAWKWALSKVQNNRTLMMNEVDSAASQKNSTVFYQTIGDSLKLFDQILIVSHKEQTRELLENEYGAQVLTFTGGVAA